MRYEFSMKLTDFPVCVCIRTLAWSTLPSLNMPRSLFSMDVVNGKLKAIYCTVHYTVYLFNACDVQITVRNKLIMI
jgi:hypothetical protein